MGTCCSKTNPSFSSPDSPLHKSQLEYRKNTIPDPQVDKISEEKTVNKEIPIVTHRKSKEIERKLVEDTEKEQKLVPCDTKFFTESISPDLVTGNSNINNGPAVVRTSSCTRDEVEAILIQCGRLSRSSSAVQTPVSSRKYSGSKRSFDFDNEQESTEVTERESRRQSRPSPNRRRTPSREREPNQPRSGSRERNNSNGTGTGRRVSRSPGRRLESPMATNNNPIGGGNNVSRPGKMVSVPATVSSMDKSMNSDGPVKRVVAKRNNAASPRRSRSPAARGNNGRVGNDNVNQNQSQGGLSRSNSRKAEHSPYRRNPLGEIDQNAQKQSLENVKNSRTKTKETPQAEENAKAISPQLTNNIGVNVVPSLGPEPIKPQAVTRTRSKRLSRDLDNLNLESQNPSPTSSYTALLLEDIQNFHNKTPTQVSLPQCLSKACSILDEIADLNSSCGNTAPTVEKYAKKLLENKEPPLMETEVVGMNDLMEPSFQKYVTVKRGNAEQEEGEESSGSNSFVGGKPQHWISSSLRETNSTDSTDCWGSSSRSKEREDNDGKKRGIDCPKMGIGQGKSIHSSSAVTVATI